MLNGCSNWMPGQYTICSTTESGIVDAAVFSYTMYVDIPMWQILCWHSSRQRLTTVALWGIERHEGGLGYANNIHESLTMIPALAVYNTQLIKIWPFTANPVVATCTLTHCHEHGGHDWSQLYLLVMVSTTLFTQLQACDLWCLNPLDTSTSRYNACNVHVVAVFCY